VSARSPSLEHPQRSAGPSSPEVLFREARRRRRQRWALGVAGVTAAALVAGAAYGAVGNPGAANRTASSTPPRIPRSIGSAWRSDGTRVFEHSIPANYSGFTPTTTISCAGRTATTCYVTVHANGVLPNGVLSTPGKWGAFATPFVSSEFVSTDRGRTWRSIVLPDEAWTSTAFSCPTPEDCAVGALVGAHPLHWRSAFIRPAAVVLVTVDGGGSWMIRHLPASAGLVRELDCRTIESCVAVTWTATATEVNGMRWDDGADVVFPTELYTTHDTGRSWATVRVPRPPPGDVYSLSSLTCPTTANCTLTGRRVHVEVVPGSYTTALHVRYYRTADSKTVVVAVDIHARSSLVELHASGPVSCVSRHHCLMITTTSDSRQRAWGVLTSTDGGHSWSKVPANGLPALPLSLQCVSRSSCLTTTGAMSNDGGRHWTSVEANIRRVSCSTTGACVALEATSVQDPHVPTGMSGTVSATRIVTNGTK
jgi:hypothetical protein